MANQVAKKTQKFVPANKLYKTPKELEKRVRQYITECEKTGKKTTVSGMCLALGFSSTHQLANYEKQDEFSDIIYWAKLAVGDILESRGRAVDIFGLKSLGVVENPSEYKQLEDENSGIMSLSLEDKIKFIENFRQTGEIQTVETIEQIAEPSKEERQDIIEAIIEEIAED